MDQHTHAQSGMEYVINALGETLREREAQIQFLFARIHELEATVAALQPEETVE